MDAFETSGLWWLPDAPDDKQGGVLSFSPEGGIRLQLIGSFHEIGKSQSDEAAKCPLILGLSNDCPLGKLVTLHKCMMSGSRVGMPGYHAEEYRVTTAFFGGHFRRQDELRFFRTRLALSYMRDWVHITGVTLNYSVDEGKKLLGCDLHYAYPSPLKARLSDMQLMLSFDAELPALGSREMRLTEQPVFDAVLDVEADLRQLCEVAIGPLRNLLTLATDRPNSVTDLTVFSRHAVDLHGASRETKSLRVVYQGAGNIAQSTRALMPPDMLFTFADIPHDFEVFATKWMTMSAKLQTSFQVFFGAKYNRTMYLTSQLLSVSQALESFHRLQFSNEVLSQEDHKRRIEEIVGSVPEKHRKWTRERLKYSNEPSLRERLHNLLEDVPQVMQPLIGKDTKKFVQKVIATRNFFVHRDPKLMASAAQGASLYWMTERLIHLFKASLLKELGFSESARVALCERNQSYLFLRRKTDNS